MDDEKLIKLNINQNDCENQSKKKMPKNSFLHTNPILKEMFFKNVINKKNKFSFKDLFK